jgi:hypothetical protein
MADKRSDEDKVKDCEKVFEQLGEIRRPYEEMIDEIFTYVLHGRRKIRDKEAPKGMKTGERVYDGTALSALNLLADGLHGYLVSPGMRWFSLGLPNKLNFARTSGMRQWNGKRMDEYPEVKEFLQDYEEVLYAAFQRSNFYETTPDLFRDGGSAGTGHLLWDEDIPNGRTIWQVPHFRECFIAEDQFGQVDTMYRLRKFTLRQLVQKFGKDKMNGLISGFDNRYDKNFNEEVEILHAAYPRSDYSPGLTNGANRQIASLWMLREGQKRLVLEDGFYIPPFITWRWRKNNDEWYGRSPAWDAFVDIMTGNQMAKTNLIGGHKMVEPPMIGPEDLRGKVNRDPKGWTYAPTSVFKNQAVPQMLNTVANLPFAVELQDRLDKKIKEYFHVDFFLMLSQAAFNQVDITATQVIEMQGEKAAILGTRVGRMHSEVLNPVIDVQAYVEGRAGRLPATPKILLDFGGHNIEVDYMGPLSQAQKRLFKTQSISAGVTKIAEIGTVFPEILDILDPVKMGVELLDSYGFPQDCIRTPEDVAKIKALRLQNQQQQQMVENATKLGGVAPGLGKTIEPKSPMDMLTGVRSGERETANA